VYHDFSKEDFHLFCRTPGITKDTDEPIIKVDKHLNMKHHCKAGGYAKLKQDTKDFLLPFIHMHN
jgi:hypothetical protein